MHLSGVTKANHETPFVYRLLLVIYHQGTIHGGLRFFVILLNLTKFWSLPCIFLFWKSESTFVFHGAPPLYWPNPFGFFHSCCGQDINWTQIQICLYHTLALCHPLITLHAPVFKMNASGDKNRNTRWNGSNLVLWCSRECVGTSALVMPLKSTDLSLYCFPGLFLLTLGAAEMSSFSFSCRALAMAVMEKIDQQKICAHCDQIQRVLLGQGREVRRKLCPFDFPGLLLKMVAAAWSCPWPRHPQHAQEVKQPPSWTASPSGKDL